MRSFPLLLPLVLLAAPPAPRDGGDLVRQTHARYAVLPDLYDTETFHKADWIQAH